MALVLFSVGDTEIPYLATENSLCSFLPSFKMFFTQQPEFMSFLDSQFVHVTSLLKFLPWISIVLKWKFNLQLSRSTRLWSPHQPHLKPSSHGFLHANDSGLNASFQICFPFRILRHLLSQSICTSRPLSQEYTPGLHFQTSHPSFSGQMSLP